MTDREINELATSMYDASVLLNKACAVLIAELNKSREDNKYLANQNIDYRLENARLKGEE